MRIVQGIRRLARTVQEFRDMPRPCSFTQLLEVLILESAPAQGQQLEPKHTSD